MVLTQSMLRELSLKRKSGVELSILAHLNAVDEGELKAALDAFDNTEIPIELRNEISARIVNLRDIELKTTYEIESIIRREYGNKVKDFSLFFGGSVSEGKQKRTRRNWSTDFTNRAKDCAKAGMSPKQAMKELCVSEDDAMSFRALYYRIRLENGGEVSTIQAKKGDKKDSTSKDEIRTVSDVMNADIDSLKIGGGTKTAFGATSAPTSNIEAVAIGGSTKHDTITTESLLHEYTAKIKMFEQAIEIKKRELAALRAVKEEYIRIYKYVKGEDA